MNHQNPDHHTRSRWDPLALLALIVLGAAWCISLAALLGGT